MKYIYLAFIAPNNKMGRFIRSATGTTYSHVAISLDISLDNMYSFGRRKRKAALVGGFVTECSSQYCSNDDVPLKLTRIQLSDDSFTRLMSILQDFKSRKDDLIYNSIDAVSTSLFKKSVYIRDCFTCLSFCCYILGYRNVYSIPDFERRLADSVVYIGSFRDYVSNPNLQDPSYYEHMSLFKVVGLTFAHFGHLFMRLFKEYV